MVISQPFTEKMQLEAAQVACCKFLFVSCLACVDWVACSFDFIFWACMLTCVTCFFFDKRKLDPS